jgi:hypothetical protein
MPGTNTHFLYSSKPMDDETDQADSTSSTPPGAHTPHPDLSDKRLPGITHSCFGQVRNVVSHSFTALSSAFTSNSSTLPVDSSQKTRSSMSMATSTILPYSPSRLSRTSTVSSPLRSSFSFQETKASSTPLSSSSSTHEDDIKQTRGSSSSYDLCQDAHSLKGLGLKRTSTASSRSQSYGYIPTAFTPLPEVDTSPAMATLIPVPSIKASMKSLNPFSSLLSKSPRQSISSKEDAKMGLTKGAPPLPLQQSTPPQTPRTRSQEDRTDSGANTPARLSNSSNIKTDGTTIGPVLGTLTVIIKEGRGLRPSIDPYVVCEFQLSQYISEGPVTQASKTSNDSSGVTIQSVAGKGRPMAIPMRSRQSSSSGRDAAAMQEVTNPKWDHKAVL